MLASAEHFGGFAFRFDLWDVENAYFCRKVAAQQIT